MLIKSYKVNHRISLMIVLILVITVAGHRLSSNDWLPQLYERDHLESLLDLSDAKGFQFGTVARRLVKAVLGGDYPVAFDELRIDIKFKHFLKLREDRRKAKQRNILHEPTTIPAKISYRGREYSIRLRLKGDLYPHWSGIKRWSFRIRLKNGATIGKMSQFSLQRPWNRQFPYDQIFHDWGRQTGSLEPGETFYRVYVNGSHWGIMLAEEHMSKHFIETNGRKEAPIVRFGSEDGWVYTRMNPGVKNIPAASFGYNQIKLYNERRYLNDPRIKSMYSYIVKSYRNLTANRLGAPNGFSTSGFLDNDLFSKVLIRAMIWNGNHTLSNANSRYYFNPYSLRLEPVSTDQEAFTLISSQNLAEMKSRMQVFSEINHLYSALVRSPLFHQRFKINLDAVLAKLATTDIAYRKLCRLFPLDCPVVDFKILAKNVEKVKKWGLASMPLPEKATVKAANNTKKQQQPVRSGKPKIVADLVYPRHIHAELLTFGTLRVFNPLPESVRISKVKASCVDQTVCKPIVLQGAEGIIKAGQGLKPNMKEFSLAIDDIGKRHFLEITTTVRGKEKIKKIQLTLSAQPYNPLTSTHIFKKPDFMLIKGNIATIAPGIWQIDQPLILPSGMTLKIAAGAVLEFAPKSYLIVRGALIANGSKDKPIRLKPSIDDWKGIYVLEASTKSHLDHVWIENTKSLTSGILQLSGGVTFYRSDVALSNVMFKGSSAEDALNIVHSDFTLENCTFAKTFSDAFDSDFSNGSLVNVHFEQIGGDGLDTSGSIVKARNLSFNRVFDKAVSAGEQSQVSIFSLSAKNVGTAIVSKDNSTTTVDHLNVENYRLFAGMAYEKKNFYGPASLVISQTKLPASAFRCQSGSQMSVNGQKIDGRDFDIKALYKLGPMRKKP